MNLTMQAVGFDADQKLMEYIDKKFGKIDNYFNRVQDVHIFLKLENSGQVKDKIVEAKIKVPGNYLVVTESSKSFEAAVDKSVSTVKRQLVRYKERLRS